MPKFPPSPLAAAARAFMVALDDQTGEPEETEEAAIEWVALNYHINQSEVELALAVAMITYRQAAGRG